MKVLRDWRAWGAVLVAAGAAVCVYRGTCGARCGEDCEVDDVSLFIPGVIPAGQEGAGTASSDEATEARENPALGRFQEAVDEEDFDAAYALAREIMRSDDRDARESLVDGLGWFGAKAIPAFRELRKDPDEEIAAAAAGAWARAVGEIEDPKEKADLLEEGLDEMLDAETFDDIIHNFDDIPKVRTVEMMLPYLMSNDPEVREMAREWFEFFFGDPFADADAAREIARKMDAEEDQF